MEQAREVRAELAKRELTGRIVDVLGGGDISTQVAQGLSEAEMVVIFGTRTYGAPGSVMYSTRQEMEFVMGNKKPFFLIKMCDEFEDPLTQLYLHKGIAYEAWNPPTGPMPAGLIDKIVAKYNQVVAAKVEDKW